MDHRQTSLRILLIILLPLFGACSVSRYNPLVREDGAPDVHVDIHQIPNATPRHEPRSASGNPEYYEVYGKRYYVMRSNTGFVERGIASWYGTKFHGRKTSSGEPYDMFAMTAAHKTLPLPTYVRVTNLENGKAVIVKVNDRGPFAKGRIIDLSYVAAKKLGIAGTTGTAYVEIRTVQPEPPRPVQARKPEPVHTTHVDSQQMYVQIGAFSNRENAERLRQNLSQLALASIQIEPGKIQNRTVYRVRIGPLNNSSDADRMLQTLSRHGHSGAHIISD